jgi:hypothetical protein
VRVLAVPRCSHNAISPASSMLEASPIASALTNPPFGVITLQSASLKSPKASALTLCPEALNAVSFVLLLSARAREVREDDAKIFIGRIVSDVSDASLLAILKMEASQERMDEPQADMIAF